MSSCNGKRSAAAVLAGRPEAAGAWHATKLPSSPVGRYWCSPNADVKAGDWRAAEAKFASLPGART